MVLDCVHRDCIRIYRQCAVLVADMVNDDRTAEQIAHDALAHRDMRIMESDLLGGGWTRVRYDLWCSPSGTLYRGPHKAWHVWAGTPMCEPR